MRQQEAEMSDYDIITIGGGLGGAALARAMALRGKRVLVLERETQYRDRVRGEGMTTWGVAEARELGIFDLLRGSCAMELPFWENCAGEMVMNERDVTATTPQGLGTLTFFHPRMQETVRESAIAAGAEVRTGVRAAGVRPGREPVVLIERDGAPEEVSARLVVGADGRTSLMRKWGGFQERRDPDCLRLSGLLFEESKAPDDRVRLVNDFTYGRASIFFPQGDGRVRAYFACRVDEDLRLQGDRDVERFVELSSATGMPRSYFEGARPAGPLATFDGADHWVDHPYRDGIALVGDAAGATDPSWGQGLSLTMRDVRVLRDALLADDDWDAAGNAYATEHDRYFGVVHTVAGWMTGFFFGRGPEADARRARAFPLIAQDPARMPDTLLSGPDHPLSDEMRQRFYAEVD
jgi:2-polyprenyl-6-methoxyphenol hydroxylase-like FAD-dependent oxidoreductase